MALAAPVEPRPGPPPAPDAPRLALAYMASASASLAVMSALAGWLGRAGVPWPWIAFVRAVVGLLACLGLARARGTSLRVFGRRAMWVRSLAGAASSLCIFYAMTHMRLADASALINTTPLWIALAARVGLREAAGRAVSVALVLGGLGVALIERPSLAIGNLDGAVALAAGMLAAVAMVSLRRLSGESPEAVVVHFASVSLVVTTVASWIGWDPKGLDRALTPLCLAGLVGVGLTAAAGQLLQTRAYAVDRAARVGTTGWLQVLLALAIDVVVLGTPVPPSTLLGIGAMLAAGVVLMVNVWHERPLGPKRGSTAEDRTPAHSKEVLR